MAKIYVSSTVTDLVEERASAMRWIAKFGYQAQDSYTADDRSLVESCLDDVASCDVYLLIVGGRYGSIPAQDNPNGLSITHLEFQCAVDRRVPVIALLREPARAGASDDADHERALKFRKEVSARYRPAHFRERDEFVGQLAAGIMLMFRRHEQQTAGSRDATAQWADPVAAELGSVAVGYPGTWLAAQVSLFCKVQLVDGGEPVPFVPRIDALSRLNAWLDDCSAPRRALVTGGAGSGKSTLLVRWIAPFAIEQPIAPFARWLCVFVPISQRFRTHNAADWQLLLCVRLATVLGCALSPAVQQGGQDLGLRGELARLCALAVQQRARVLIVVDGIDETVGGAFGAEWFPSDAPEHLRLLVSARHTEEATPQSWLHSLGWDHARSSLVLSMSALTEPEIRAMLDDAKLPGLHSGLLAQVSGHVMRLSEGDPIVCRYVLAEIPDCIDAQGQLDERRISGWRRGLQGFFHRWIKSLKTIEFGPDNVAAAGRIDTMYQVLAMLARARGPLPIRALTTLVRAASAGRLSATTRDLDLLSRWVLKVQDDRPDAGNAAYVLAHPRLNEYLAVELASERSDADLAFAAWCAEAPTHCSAVDASPALRGYLVSYAALHLAESRPNALPAMATRAWKELSLAQTRSLRLFARDIDLCEQAARTPEPDWPRLIGCRLLNACMRRRDLLPERLPAALVRHGVLTLEQAYEWLPGDPETVDRSNGRLALATASLTAVMPPETRAPLAQRLLGVARRQVDQDQEPIGVSWCLALVELARHLTSADEESLRNELELAAIEALWQRGNVLDFKTRLYYLLPRIRPRHLDRILNDILRLSNSKWFCAAMVLAEMQKSEACAHVAWMNPPEGDVSYLLPWLTDDDWGPQKSRVLDALRTLADQSDRVSGHGEAVALARYAAIGGEIPDPATAEQAFAIVRRIANESDMLAATGHLLRYSRGEFDAKVRAFALTSVRFSVGYCGATRFDSLAPPGAFIGRDVSDVVALAEELPRAAGLDMLGYVADELTPAQAARAWHYAATARFGDEGQQWLCKALFFDVMTEAEREDMLRGLLSCERALYRPEALRQLPDDSYIAIADRLLATLRWGDLFNSTSKFAYCALLQRAERERAIRIFEIVMAENVGALRWDEPVLQALGSTTEAQLPYAVILATVQRCLAAGGKAANLDESTMRALRGKSRREGDPQGAPTDVSRLRLLTDVDKSRAELLTALHDEAPTLRLLAPAERRNLYEAICNALEVFP